MSAVTNRGGYPIKSIACLLALLILAGCIPSPSMRERTVTLRPVAMITHLSRDTERHTYPFPFDCPWRGVRYTEEPPIGTIFVGFDNHFEPGTDPFPCLYKNDYAFRGGVLFNVRSIQQLPRKVVMNAELTWSVDHSLQRDARGNPRGVPTGPNAADCVAEVLESTGSIHDEGPFLPGSVLRRGKGDVTGVVQAWVMRGEPNRGFVLKGNNERFERNSAACRSTIGDLRLTITYLAR